MGLDISNSYNGTAYIQLLPDVNINSDIMELLILDIMELLILDIMAIRYNGTAYIR